MKFSITKILIILSSIIVVGITAAGMIFLKPWQLLATRAQARTETVFALDLDQAVIPEHSTQRVKAEFSSEVPIRFVQLWVNAQLWADEVIDPPQSAVVRSWDWSPSGEGVHELLVRYQLTDGTEHLSPIVEVYALQVGDAHLPVDYSVQAGETLTSISQAYGAPLPMLLESNLELGVGADDPLPEGTALIVPIPVPNPAQAFPANGEAAAPPVKPLPSNGVVPIAGAPGSAQVVAANLPPEALMPGFQIVGGQLKTPVPVDQLYLYLRLADAPWQRSPIDPHAFYQPGPNGTFDVSLDLDLESLQKLPKAVPLDLEAWGWTGGNLVFLGLYHDLVGGPGGSLSWPPENTQLKALDYTNLGKSIYLTEINISGSQPTLTRKFHWVSTEPDANHILWQVSLVPFNSPAAQWGLLHSGNRPGIEGDFTLNFRDYFKKWGADGGFASDLFDPIKSIFEDLTNDLSGSTKPKQAGWPFKPTTFYVRVIPMDGSGSVGKASNTVVVHFTPAGLPVESAGPLDGPVYDAKVVSFTPYRAADPAYATCQVTNYDVRNCGQFYDPNKSYSHSQYQMITSPETAANLGLTLTQYNQCTIITPIGTPVCGCPGAPCSSGGGSSCLSSLNAFGSCVSDTFEAGAQALQDAVEWATSKAGDIYNGAVNFVVDTLASALCPSSAKSECKAVISVGVKAGMAALGIPPEIPDFDKLFNEGLDYAVAVAASQLTGIDCNKLCRDLLKKGFEAATSGQNLFKEGLKVGVSMAADELGVKCDQQCEALINKGVEGDLKAGDVTDYALDQAASKAAGELIANGYSCDSDCEEKIKAGLKQGLDLAESVVGSSPSAPTYEPWLKIHPLALEQPAVIYVELFRRWESGDVSDEDLDKCNIAIYNQASNANFSQPVTGKLFGDVGKELPVLEPGESMTVPIVLERVPWNRPPGVTVNMPPNSDNIIIASLDPVFGSWHEFYPGAQITFDVTGPNFLALDGQGGTVSIPCVAGDSYGTSIPLLP